MTLSKIYRTRAAALAKQAKSASAPISKERFERMALAYERLAEKYAKRPPLYKRKPKPDGTLEGLVENQKSECAGCNSGYRWDVLIAERKNHSLKNGFFGTKSF